MSKENNNSTSGIGILGLLQVAFIILKVCNVITWSWVAVFIPTFIYFGIIALVVGAGLLFAWIAKML